MSYGQVWTSSKAINKSEKEIIIGLISAVDLPNPGNCSSFILSKDLKSITYRSTIEYSIVDHASQWLYHDSVIYRENIANNFSIIYSIITSLSHICHRIYSEANATPIY